MRQRLEIEYRGRTLRGVLHIPDNFGAGPFPLSLILPGFDGTKVGPHRLLLQISQELETIGISSLRFDFLGSGESDGESEEITLSDQVNQTLLILNAIVKDRRFDSKQVYMIGFSMGGTVACLAAGSRPDLFKKIVLISPLLNLQAIVQNIISKTVIPDNFTGTIYYDFYGNRFTIDSANETLTMDFKLSMQQFSGSILAISGSRDGLAPPTIIKKLLDETYHNGFAHHIINGADHGFRKFDFKASVLTCICSFLRSEGLKKNLYPRD